VCWMHLPYSRFERLEDVALIDDGAPPAPDWVFCLGFARNGTTALTRIVSAHPRATLLNEVWLWGYATVLRTSEFGFGGGAQLRIANDRLLELAGDRSGHTGAWTTSAVRELMEGLRRALAPDDLVFGDKRGAYLVHLADVLRVFPGCRLMIALRDLWDRAALRFEPRAPGAEPVAVTREFAEIALQAARDDEQRVERIRQQCAGHDFRIVWFDELAADPRSAILGILDFLGLDATGYDWNVLDTLHHSYSNQRWRAFPELAALREAETDADPPAEAGDGDGWRAATGRGGDI